MKVKVRRFQNNAATVSKSTPALGAAGSYPLSFTMGALQIFKLLLTGAGLLLSYSPS